MFLYSQHFSNIRYRLSFFACKQRENAEKVLEELDIKYLTPLGVFTKQTFLQTCTSSNFSRPIFCFNPIPEIKTSTHRRATHLIFK